MIPRTLLFAFLIGFMLSSTTAHDSCCKHKLLQQQQQSGETTSEEYIVDPTDLKPPDVFDDVPRLIPDPSATRPDDWDDEDDGPWEADWIENPDYAWRPRRIRNPHYIPPVTYWAKLRSEVLEAVPWVTLGAILTALLGASPLSSPERIGKHLGGGNVDGGRGTSVLPLVKAAVIGLATPLCSCGALPVAAGLVASGGATLPSAVAFLTASQSAGFDSAAVTWGLLGPVAAVCRLLGATVLAIAAGLAVGACHDVRGSRVGTKEKPPTESSPQKTPADDLTTLSLGRLGATLLDVTMDVFPTVLAGLAISTALVHHIPPLLTSYDALLDREGRWGFSSSPVVGPLVLRLGVLLSSLPLQLCEHTAVTLASAIRRSGGSPGLAFAFLMSAPATNVASLLLLQRAAGTVTRTKTKRVETTGWWRGNGGLATVGRVALALTTAALGLSYLVDVVGLDLLVDGDGAGTSMASSELPRWYVAASPWIATMLVVAGVARRLFCFGSSGAEVDSGCPCPTSGCGERAHDSKKMD